MRISNKASLPVVRKFLKNHGYLPGVRRIRLWKLDERAVELAEAVLRFQQTDINAGEINGDLDDETIAAMELPRCDCLDYYDDPELVDGSMGRYSAGTGSWPTSCHETGIKVSIDTRNAPSWVKVDEVFAHSAREYAKVGLRLVRVPVGGFANIKQTWRSFAGGTIGLAQFNSRSCSNSVFNNRSTTWRGNDDLQKNLDLHELGHNNNLQHTRGGIMNPSITSTRSEWVAFDSAGKIIYQDISYPALRGFFGGTPLDPNPNPNPSPNPTPNPNPQPNPQPNQPCLELLRTLFNC